MENLKWKMENPVVWSVTDCAAADDGIFHISFSICHFSFEGNPVELLFCTSAQGRSFSKTGSEVRAWAGVSAKRGRALAAGERSEPAVSHTQLCKPAQLAAESVAPLTRALEYLFIRFPQARCARQGLSSVALSAQEMRNGKSQMENGKSRGLVSDGLRGGRRRDFPYIIFHLSFFI